MAESTDDIVFVLGEMAKETFDVYGVDTAGSSIRKLVTIEPTNSNLTEKAMGFAVCGSKLCAVGGDFDEEIKKFVGEFLMCDLTNWKIRDGDDFKCKRPAGPHGVKPRPIVFSVEKRLYALAGSFHTEYEDVPGPCFEVYDPYDKNPQWKKLLDPPPFGESSSEICGYKVKGHTLYVAFDTNEQDNFAYYSYSLTEEKWAALDIDKTDTCITNLAKFGNWEGNEDFYDDGNTKMFFNCRGNKVLACDLQATRLDPRRKQNPNYFSYEDDYYDDDGRFWFYNTYPYLHVHGLDEHIKAQGGQSSATVGFVAHLAKNIFCAVYIFNDPNDFYKKKIIHACKFELTKQNGEEFNALTDTLSGKVLACCRYEGIDW